MAHWIQATGARASRPFDNIELPVNMPASWSALMRPMATSDSH